MNTKRCALTKRTDLALDHYVTGIMRGRKVVRAVNYIGAAMANAWIESKKIDELMITPDSIKPFDNITKVEKKRNVNEQRMEDTDGSR